MAITTVKIVISIPSQLFKEVKRLAKELAMSRSALFAKAAEEFIKKNKNRRLLAALNKAYKEGPDEEERRLLSAAKENFSHLVEEHFFNQSKITSRSRGR